MVEFADISMVTVQILNGFTTKTFEEISSVIDA